MFNVHVFKAKNAKLLAGVLAAACMCLGLAACGNSSSSASVSAQPSLPKLEGVSATGESGGEPRLHFKHPMTVSKSSYVVLVPGSGERLKEGDTVCYQYMVYNARTGEKVDSTWGKAPLCDLTLNDSVDAQYRKVFLSQKLGASVAFGMPGEKDSSASGVANSADSYINVITMVSVEKVLPKAEGEKVENIPQDLPKVTVDGKTGEPKIDFNGYRSDGKLVSQTLIKGSGAKVEAGDSIVVKYTGWVLGTKKQFQSTWSEGNTTANLTLSDTVAGFKEGLVGKTVGSQVLLVIPPKLGYGDKSQGSIPANSTLVFVVDILAANG